MEVQINLTNTIVEAYLFQFPKPLEIVSKLENKCSAYPHQLYAFKLRVTISLLKCMRMSTTEKLYLKGLVLTPDLDLALALNGYGSDAGSSGGSGAGFRSGTGSGTGRKKKEEMQLIMTMLKLATPSGYNLGPSSPSKFNMNERHGNENEMTTIPKLLRSVYLGHDFLRQK